MLSMALIPQRDFQHLPICAAHARWPIGSSTPWLVRKHCFECCNICYNPSMKTLEAIRKLNDIAFSQRGLFTTAQAQAAGVDRYIVSRLERAGNVERLAKGVYRMGGAPSPREEDVLAVWLSVDPGRTPGDISTGDVPVAMGATAAWLHGLGEIGPVPYEFCTRERRQTQRLNLRLKKRCLAPEDVTIAAGIPVTTPIRTVIDLIDEGEDLSLVANVLNDALRRGIVVDEEAAKAEVDKRGAAIGLSKEVSLYEAMTGRRP